MAYDYIIGIDEVGRGPIAGPVAVGACLLRQKEQNLNIKIKNALKRVKDSKQLSEKQREEWFVQIQEWQKEGVLDYAVSFVSPQVIDRIGIAPAIRRALSRSLGKLSAEPTDAHVLLDGGLVAPEEWVHQKTIIGGDGTEPAISLASIVAKVLRDRRMVRYAEQYPEYGFERHKGYGTRAHMEAVGKHGVCDIHRLTFMHK